MRYLLIVFAILISQCGCTSNASKIATTPAPLFTDIIPQPLSLVKGEGRFTINEQTALLYDAELEKAADYLRL